MPQLTFTSGHYQAPYQTFQAFSRYVYESGLFQQPTAGSAGPSDVCRLHAPAGRRLYFWVVERVGVKPLLPHPETHEVRQGRESLLHAEIVPFSPELTDARQPFYRVEGVYVYALLYPVFDGTADKLRTGLGPHINGSPDAYTYGSSDFSKTIQ